MAGQEAKEATAGDVAIDYSSQPASNTRRTQTAGSTLFAYFLDQAHEGLGAGSREYAPAVADFPAGDALDPAAWRGVTWRLVNRFDAGR